MTVIGGSRITCRRVGEISTGGKSARSYSKKGMAGGQS